MGIIKNIKREINKVRFVKEINKNITNYRYVHVMVNDKFNKPTVDRLNKNGGEKEHMVLCCRVSTDYKARPFPVGSNVYEYVTLDGIHLEYENIEKIIFHALNPSWVKFLYKNKDLLKKSYWGIWGWDLYNAPRDEMNDYVRKNFKGYITGFDEAVAREKYNIPQEQKFYKGVAIFPITKEMLDNSKKEQKDYIKIQINNSCDNSTLEMLDILSKFKDEKIKISTVVSYGKMEYKDAVIEKGKEIFGDKFEYLEKLMSPQEYVNHIAQNDILVLNQNRQQGVGNTNAAIYLGQKVFIRRDVSVNRYYNEEGIKIYNTESIKDLSFNEFIENRFVEQSKQNILKYFDPEYGDRLFKEFLEAE